ncbi:epoxide hydrolase 1 [Daldinia decipiens]|uniref:epoxide hydrolase 1 n=1 Tax=Daldinia decipiens TaxID=326647 RepID=UPI0020C3F706|nr:epoxide hydrolase 1 [Daldinia decipiens]KAI1659518.1 epoxide hydrolase 1 [Daldinia decipiens]
MSSPDDAVEPFRIAVSGQAIEALKAKLALATFPRETSFSNDGDYGARLDDVKRLATAWRDTFDWREAEAKLNDILPQFTTRIAVDGHEDDLKVHFVHAQSERKDAIPLLFCHGWPGSFIEVTKILPLLTAGAGEDEPAFHVVAPSLPNFGFSQATSKPGFGIPQHAEVCLVLRNIYRLQPQDIQPPKYNQHLTPPTTAQPHAPPRIRQIRNAGRRLGIHDHPRHERKIPHACTSIASKLHPRLSAQPALLAPPLPPTRLRPLHRRREGRSRTHPMVPSQRLYYEAMHQKDVVSAGKQTAPVQAWNGKVPLGLSYFPKDIAVLPSSWGRTLGPVVFEKRHEQGGHFASFEKPDELVADLRTMFGKSGIRAKLLF